MREQLPANKVSWEKLQSPHYNKAFQNMSPTLDIILEPGLQE